MTLAGEGVDGVKSYGRQIRIRDRRFYLPLPVIPSAHDAKHGLIWQCSGCSLVEGSRYYLLRRFGIP